MSEEVYIVRGLEKKTSITSLVKEKGYNLQTNVLECKVIEANYKISKMLEIPLASKVFCLEKLRIVEGIPCMIDKTYIDAKKVAGLEKEDFNNISFYEVIKDKYGYEVTKSVEEILIVEATHEECTLLGLDEHEEVTLIKGVTYLNNNQPFEYSEDVAISSFYRVRSVSSI